MPTSTTIFFIKKENLSLQQSLSRKCTTVGGKVENLMICVCVSVCVIENDREREKREKVREERKNGKGFAHTKAHWNRSKGQGARKNGSEPTVDSWKLSAAPGQRRDLCPPGLVYVSKYVGRPCLCE